MATTWNPADKSANITLSLTNHLATTAGGAGNEGVRGTTSKTTTGKWYVEFTSIVTVNSAGFGIGDASETITGSGVPAFRVIQDGTVFQPNGSSFNPGWGAPDGKTVSMALDLPNDRGWFRYDAGSWAGPSGLGADPTVPSTGFNLVTRVNPSFIKAFLQFSGHTVKLNAGDSAALQSIPSGFIFWDFVAPYVTGQAAVLS